MSFLRPVIICIIIGISRLALSQPVGFTELAWNGSTNNNVIVFDPTNSAIVWFDSLSYVYKDAGTNLANLGDFIYQWNDRIGLNILQQTNPAYQAVLGYDSSTNLDFNATFDFNSYSNKYSFTLAQPYTICSLIATTPDFTNCFLVGSTNSTNVYISYVLDVNSNLTIAASCGNRVSFTSGFISNYTTFVTVVCNGVSSSIYTNSMLLTTGNLGSNPMSDIKLGVANGTETYFFGQVHCILIYPYALTSNHIGQIQQFVTNRYGIYL